MGLMRFLVQDRDRIADDALDRIYVGSMEEIPWRCHNSWDGDVLVVRRSVSESGCVHVPWSMPSGEETTLATSTLMERETPYLLDVELVRGSLNRLRNQLAIWESIGLVTPPSVTAGVAEATQSFGRAATTQRKSPETAGSRAKEALAVIHRITGELSAAYTAQALEVRSRQASKLTTLMGVQLGTEMPTPDVARKLVDAVNVISIPMQWSAIEAIEGQRDWTHTDAQVQWCQAAGLKINAGPLLPLDDRGVPDWLYLWEGDFESLTSFMVEQVRTVVNRYRGKVHLWQVASRVNSSNVLSLTEEERLRIVAQAIGEIRNLDSRTPIVASFDQPWAEDMAQQDLDLSPLHFADALVRADLGLAGIGLEINEGYLSRGTQQRSPIEYSRLIDQWSLLGLPLVVSLCTPSSSEEDELADPKIRVQAQGRQHRTGQTQRDWVAARVPLLLAKNSVQLILWNELSDAQPHELPHGGLLDDANREKPALSLLRDIRKKYLL